MNYTPKDYSNLLGTPGFSDELLNNHFTLYQGYVKNTNSVAELLAKSETAPYEYGEVKRRFGWEFNGMRLHEYYFDNLVNGGNTLPDGPLAHKIQNDFGSFDAWKQDFLKTGEMRGIGWVILSYDKVGDRLFNTWINEHDMGHLSGTTPLLVMDVFEHAFITDYGLKKVDYIQAFFNAINWEKTNKRF